MFSLFLSNTNPNYHQTGVGQTRTLDPGDARKEPAEYMKFSIKNSMKWSIFISLVTLGLSILFTVVSTTVLEGAGWGIGMVIVLFFILIGILFDILGLAAASAVETPFHAMAAKKVPGARQAIQVVRNADRFSNICNDVIGDICGIVSGSASATVILKLMLSFGDGHELLRSVVSIVFTAIVSALTVGGKAMGKSFAISYSKEIVLFIGKVFHILERTLHIRLLQPKRKQKTNGKRGKQNAG